MDVRDALDMYEAYKTYWDENYREARIDLKMAMGDPETHWGSDIFSARQQAKKSVTVINELPQFIHQVTNDIRQNTPSINVIPEADGDIETAEVFSGLIRSIEYKSNADEVYDTAAEYAVKCGIGFIRVDHDYCDDETDEQELILRRVPDPLSVFLDPASIECDGRDADGAIILEPITKKAFEKLYPGKQYASFTDPKGDASKDDGIVIAEIFVREYTMVEGRRTNPVVRRYKYSGAEQLAQTTFPGKYIPLIPVYGEETWVNGKRIISSLIRQARGPQLRLNHWAAKESEILNMAPIAPVMAAQGTLVNDRNQWQSPGSEMVLEYNLTDVDGNPAPAPTRLSPPPIPTGIINAMQGAKENIKESMGLYNASIGQKSNETSGVAIANRQREGDVATFHFADNHRRSISQCGRVLVYAAPEVYDTPRVVQVFDEETEPKMVAINGAAPLENQKQRYDLTKGKYHVRVTTGVSHTTKRQEAAAFMADLFKQAPELLNVGGDILFKNMDLPGAQAMAARMKRMIEAQNPNLIEDENNPQPIDLEKQQMAAVIQQGQQQMQMMQAQLAQLEQELKSKQSELAVKANDTQSKTSVEMAKLEVQKQESDLEASIKAQELQLKAKELELKGIEMMMQMQQPKPQEPTESPEDAAHEEQEAQMRLMQTQAVLEAVGGIRQSLDSLTMAVQQPKMIIYDDNGNPIGAR